MTPFGWASLGVLVLYLELVSHWLRCRKGQA